METPSPPTNPAIITPKLKSTVEHLQEEFPKVQRIVTIKAGHQHAIYCPVNIVPAFINYSFHTEEHSINFAILKANCEDNLSTEGIIIHQNCSKESIFDDADDDDDAPPSPSPHTKTILDLKRYSSIDLPNGKIENSISITEKGIYIFIWCNSFSYSKEKHISLSIQYCIQQSQQLKPIIDPSKGSIFWKRKDTFPLKRWSKKFFLLQKNELKWWNNIFDYEISSLEDDKSSSINLSNCSSITQIPSKLTLIIQYGKASKILQIRSLSLEQFDVWKTALHSLIEHKEDNHSLILSGYQDRIATSLATNRLLLSHLRDEVRKGDDGSAGRFLKPMESAFHSLDDLFHCLDDYAGALSISPANSPTTSTTSSFSSMTSSPSSHAPSLFSSTASSLIDPNEVFEDDMENDFYDTEEYNNECDDTIIPLRTRKQEFRDKLPHIPSECKVSLGQIFIQNLGKPMSMPVALNEPITILQKLAEDFEWGGVLLHRIIEKEIPSPILKSITDHNIYRMSLVAAFAISSYSSSQWRMSRKPFTCLLSETYELRRDLVDSSYSAIKGEGFRFLAEKISHKPLAVAAYARSDNLDWEWWTYQIMKNSHKGSTMDLRPEGMVNLRIGEVSQKQHYQWNKVITSAKNVFSTTGKRLEHNGVMEISLLNSSYSCLINFKPNNIKDISLCNQISGRILNYGKDTGFYIIGYWDLYIDLVDSKMIKIERLWSIEHLIGDASLKEMRKYYGFNPWTLSLNDPLYGFSHPLPPTDSRMRTDQRALEMGDLVLAGSEKLRLEAIQRKNLKDFEPEWFIKTSKGDYEIKDKEEGYWKNRTFKH